MKQTLVTQARNERTGSSATSRPCSRKVRELGMALALKRKHDKDWILERYVNTAYFGAGAYGVQAAAEHYFGIDATDLDLRQAALLAGSSEPVGLRPHPAERHGANVGRRPAADGWARDVGERRARRVARRTSASPQPVHNGSPGERGARSCDYAVQYLLDDLRWATPTSARRMLREGGLTIHTTFDLRHQRAAEQAVADRTDPTDAAIGAWPWSSPARATCSRSAQSRPMGGDAANGETFVNHGVPPEYGGSQGFQAGSTFKTFVLAAAVEQGIALDTTYATPNTMCVRPGRLRQLRRGAAVRR